MADLGVLAKFVITRLYGHLWSRSLHQNVVLCLHFKSVQIRRWCHLRQGVFETPIFGLLLSILPWSTLGKILENGRLSVLAKFVINEPYGHLWSRSLQQNVVLCLDFKSVQIRRWCYLRQGVFEAPIAGLLLSMFPWSTLGKILENGRFWCPCQICHNSAIRTLMEPKFAAKCCLMFALQVHTN